MPWRIRQEPSLKQIIIKETHHKRSMHDMLPPAFPKFRACLTRAARVMFILLVIIAARGPAQAETLRVGVEGSYPPFNYFDVNGRLTGFDVEIALAICQELQRHCRFVLSDWTEIIDGLEQERYDVIIASLSITEERKKRVLFTDSYYSNALRYVARKDRPASKDLKSSLVDARITVAEGSLAASYARKHHGHHSVIRATEGQEAAFVQLLLGNTDFVLSDALPTHKWLQSQDGQCCEFVSPPIQADEGIGMAVRKDDVVLRDKLNAALDRIIANGTYDAINRRYFPFSIY